MIFFSTSTNQSLFASLIRINGQRHYTSHTMTAISSTQFNIPPSSSSSNHLCQIPLPLLLIFLLTHHQRSKTQTWSTSAVIRQNFHCTRIHALGNTISIFLFFSTKRHCMELGHWSSSHAALCYCVVLWCNGYCLVGCLYTATGRQPRIVVA